MNYLAELALNSFEFAAPYGLAIMAAVLAVVLTAVKVLR